MDFHRLDGESEDELLCRIVNQKDELGLTWDHIAGILNEILGKDIGESGYRKKWVRKYRDRQNDNQIDNLYDEISNHNDNFETEAMRLQKERIKLQSEKIEYNKYLREQARDELLIEKIANAITALSPLETPEYIKPERDNRSYLLTLADAHFAIEFQIKDFFGNIINEYSPEIFKERMEKLFSEVVDTIKKEDIKELNVWGLGDDLNGIIRLNSQLMQMRYGVIESAILYAEYMATWLNKLSEYVRIKFQMVKDSNHNQLRICGAPKNAFPDENMSVVISSFLKERLKNNPNIVIIDNPTGMNYSQLSTYAVCGIHGEVKNLTQSLNDFSRAYQIPLDYIIMGHKHHSKSEEIGIDAEAIMIKSLIGVDPYAQSLQKTSNAGANLFVFEQGKGKVLEYTYKLN